MLTYFMLIDTDEEKNKFEQLYLKYRQIMFYSANRILNDTYRAEDAVHQAFLRLIHHLDKIKDVESPKSKKFLITIVEHISIDIYRKIRRENTASYQEIDMDIKNVREHNIPASPIDEFILKLPLSYSTVLRLKYSQGYSDQEIATILDLKQDNVRQRLSRAKSKLKQLMEEEGYKL